MMPRYVEGHEVTRPTLAEYCWMMAQRPTEWWASRAEVAWRR